ncbi:putative transcription regulator protein [Janibacter sp. HTCC2649]|uniref:TetR/AcrR family transcriptional regulator n=1 Tax=Janibacter sp. HTCC2649 TaxID=313589 RepID=UPI0000670B0F|nr:TetR/AcrR family transcriptional regulator [Janibacter sp. HTCC2649]EAQ00620.1 putative transcription regulator protein [Janibacter sp. HTCC2649]
MDTRPTTSAPEAALAFDTNEDDALGWRAQRTRESILEASRKLFLERGYAGTRINNITDTCGISRAGFYTYFKDKREVFNLLGQTAYDDILAVIALWDGLPMSPSREDIVGWVNAYFAFMDRHGAFIFSSAQSGPTDADVRALSKRMQLRVSFLLGMHLRSRQTEPTSAPEALGLTALAGLDRSWFLVTVQDLGVGRDDVIQAIASIIHRGVSDG